MDNENLAALAREIAALKAAEREPQAPKNAGAAVLLHPESKLPVMIGGRPVDFEHEVEVGRIVHPKPVPASTLAAVVEFYKRMSPADLMFICVASPFRVEILTRERKARFYLC